MMLLKYTTFISFIILISFNLLEAKRINKVQFCHWSEGQGMYLKIEVPEPAFAVHLSKHEKDMELPSTGECNVNSSRVFALAYIDVVHDGIFDPEVDVLISKLEDTNGDNTFSVGDTLFLGNYPLNFDPCPGGVCIDVGSFNMQQYVLTQEDVDGLLSDQGESVKFSTQEELLYAWFRSDVDESHSISSNDLEGGISIYFADYSNEIGDFTRAEDPLNTVVNTAFPEQFDQSGANTDNYFINVELDNPDFGEEPPPTEI